MEEYRPIDDYPNYAVSNLGNVKNIRTGRILRYGLNSSGYKVIDLYNNGKSKTQQIHKLVGKAFLPNPENKPCIDHKNNNKLDNRLENLRFATLQENSRNCKISSRNTSGIKGVNWHKKTKKWQASICIDGLLIHLGLYDSIEEAKQARIIKANQVFGNFVNECEKI